MIHGLFGRLLSLFGRLLSGHAGRIGCALTRSLETHSAPAPPANGIALPIGHSDDRVVERRMNVSLSLRDILAHTASCPLLSPSLRHPSSPTQIPMTKPQIPISSLVHWSLFIGH
jgi:hypothetical protein